MPEKYKDEIEEILKSAGEAAPSRSADKSERQPEDRPRGRDSMVSRNASAPRSRLSQSRPSITPGKLMLIGVITLIVGIKFWPLIWVGLAILAGGYMMYFMRPRSISYEKRWRGRSVEEDTGSQWERLKRWIKN